MRGNTVIRPETPVQAREMARVSDAEKHTYVENKDKTLHSSVPLDISCHMIYHMSFIYAQYIPPR